MRLLFPFFDPSFSVGAKNVYFKPSKSSYCIFGFAMEQFFGFALELFAFVYGANSVEANVEKSDHLATFCRLQTTGCRNRGQNEISK